MNDTNSTVRIMGVEIGSEPLDALIFDAMRAISKERSQISFACANPHSLVVAQNDSVFLEALQTAEQVVADGIGLVMAGKMANFEVSTRITGADYYFALMAQLNAQHKRVFFLGSTPEVLGKIEARIATEYPGIEAVGALSPPFGIWSDKQNQKILDEINAFQADVVWVGMTAPKQEKWIHYNRQNIDAPVMGAIGAVFDFYAGTHPRAPDWINSNGLEWLYRLVREPRRMWRRNFVSAPRFLWHVLQERIRSPKSSPASVYK